MCDEIKPKELLADVVIESAIKLADSATQETPTEGSDGCQLNVLEKLRRLTKNWHAEDRADDKHIQTGGYMIHPVSLSFDQRRIRVVIDRQGKTLVLKSGSIEKLIIEQKVIVILFFSTLTHHDAPASHSLLALTVLTHSFNPFLQLTPSFIFSLFRIILFSTKKPLNWIFVCHGGVIRIPWITTKHRFKLWHHRNVVY